MSKRSVTAKGPHSLALAGLIGIALTQSPALGAPMQGENDPPESIRLTGVIRDFREHTAEGGHPDFNVTPVGGYGHYAGNIALVLGPDDRPVFEGDGFKVISEWTDSAYRPIAPHLFDELQSAVVMVASAPTVINQGVIDTFDSSLGPYGGANIGPAPALEVGAPMPEIPEPTGFGDLVGEVFYDGDSTSILADDLHCQKLLIRTNHTLQISGDVTILVEEEFKVENHASLELLPNASLALYVKKDATVQDHALMNVNTADPSRLSIYNLGSKQFIIQNQSHVYAWMVSPNAFLQIQDLSGLYGRFTGQTVSIQNQSGLHIDGAAGIDICGNEINDSPGTPGLASSGGISSAESFDQWYRDVLGINVSAAHTITLLRNDAGVYEYLDDAFRPIDGRLFGNQDDDHNNYFTYGIEVEFVYEACAGQFLEFDGSDDAWLFVGGALGIDLGGVSPGTEQYLDLDRLGLADGVTYQLHFFYAQRQPWGAGFRLRTNILPLTTGSVATVTASFD